MKKIRNLSLDTDINTIYMKVGIENLFAEDIMDWYLYHHTEQALADAYVICEIGRIYYDDCQYDFEDDTPEYEEAKETAEEWWGLEEELESEIKKALKKDDPNTSLTIPDFMRKHGYTKELSWWHKQGD